MNPTNAIDGSALNEMHVVFLRPFQSILEAPVTAIECVGVKSDLWHTKPLRFGFETSTVEYLNGK
jgi:hypothetical protein